jgi:hypothetical protein
VTDPYIKLRPRGPTPAEELCDCSSPATVMLQHRLTDNPIVCLSCGGEVPPERIALPPDLADTLGQWNGVYEALYTLWLDSDEYEHFARATLEDFRSSINQRGFDLAQRLNELVPCHYYVFRDAEDDYIDTSSCPRCSGPLHHRLKWRECLPCKIFV